MRLDSRLVKDEGRGKPIILLWPVGGTDTVFCFRSALFLSLLFFSFFCVSSSLSISFLFFVVLVMMRQTLSTNNFRGTEERDHRRGQEIYNVG